MPISKEKGSFRVFFLPPSGYLDTSVKRISHYHFPFMNRIQHADATKFQLCRNKKFVFIQHSPCCRKCRYL